jgi:hypothetical protein
MGKADEELRKVEVQMAEYAEQASPPPPPTWCMSREA